MAFYTWEYFETAFSRKKERNEKNEVSNETEKKEVFESFVDWFSSFFIIKIIFFLYVPFFCIIYYLEAKDKKKASHNQHCSSIENL